MLSNANINRRLVVQDLRVDSTANPDWVSGLVRVPQPGEQVICAEGRADVVKVLGRTGDGSRLLELALHSGQRAPFFAAASNVLVAPEPPVAAEAG